jgi:hypothetical protein
MKKNDNLKKLKSASLTAKEIYLLIGGDKEPINNGNAILGCMCSIYCSANLNYQNHNEVLGCVCHCL